MLDDNDLLNFPTSKIAGADAGDPRRFLHEHGDLYRVQLLGALWLEGYLERRLESHRSNPIRAIERSDDYMDGFEEAMRDVIAHIRQGDFLPGSVVLREEESRRRSP